jgi:hypothetical protein
LHWSYKSALPIIWSEGNNSFWIWSKSGKANCRCILV